MLLKITLMCLSSHRRSHRNWNKSHILSVLSISWMLTALIAVSKKQTSRILPKKNSACLVNFPSAMFYSFSIFPSAAIFCSLTAAHSNRFWNVKRYISQLGHFFCTYETLDAVVGSVNALASYIVKSRHWEAEWEKEVGQLLKFFPAFFAPNTGQIIDYTKKKNHTRQG